jgi:hypothetical protein
MEGDCSISSFASFYSQTRLRVQLAPGFPCALCGSEGQRNCKAQAKIAP